MSGKAQTDRSADAALRFAGRPCVSLASHGVSVSSLRF